MIGTTPHERDLAIASGPPATAFSFAVAELNMYLDQHPQGAPRIRKARMNLRLEDDGDSPPEEKIAAVKAIAAWLGVQEHYCDGCWIAQKRFGDDEGELIVEAHYTPDPTRAHFERLAAKEAQDAPVSGDAPQRQAVAA
jgi:hypothetical protein